MMRAPLGLCVCLLLLLGPAAAGDETPAGKAAAKARTLTTEEAADAVLAAVQAKDGDALEELAAKDEPDPWLVADGLCYRTEHDAAEAFARAAPRKAVEALPDYVASRRSVSADAAVYERVSAMRIALQSDAPAEALRLAGDADSAPASVVAIRLEVLRGIALNHLVRLQESARVLSATARAARHLGWLLQAAKAHHLAARAAHRAGDWKTARAAWLEQIELLEALGDEPGLADAASNIGMVHFQRGEFPAAKTWFRRALEGRTRDGGDPAGAARALRAIGMVHERLGEYEDALRCHETALARARELGDVRGEADAHVSIGNVHAVRSAIAEALDHTQQALTAYEKVGDQQGISWALGNLGSLHSRLGEFIEARAFHRRSLAICESRGNKAGVVGSLLGLGSTQWRTGDYARALDSLERALSMAQSMGYQRAIAGAWSSLGVVHQLVGESDKALECLESALSLQDTLGDRKGVSDVLGDIGALQLRRGEVEEALARFRRSVAMKEELGDRLGAAAMFMNVGICQQRSGDYAAALATYTRVLEHAEALGNGPRTADALVNLAVVQTSLRRHAEAGSTYHRALSVLAESPDHPTRARALQGLARVQLAQGDAHAAMRSARAGVREVQALIGGLAEEQGARARDLWLGPYELGMRAAAVAGDAASLAFFMESGRAASLRASLGARETLRSVLLPPELQRAEAVARVREASAVRAMREAAARRSLPARRAAKADLEAARHALEEIVTRIQRVGRAGAAIAYPQADSLADLQGHLAKSEALVLYGLSEAEGVALVVERKSVRSVTLADSIEIEAAAATLTDSLTSAAVAVDPVPLRRLIVDPLGLGAGITRVLLSPMGRLGYVPFATLLPGRSVAYVPSGTTLGILLEEHQKTGQGILALGDPHYATGSDGRTRARRRGSASFRLVPLPATRAEVNAISTRRLLGAEATEAALGRALAGQARWRAVHFACHGLLDPEHPMFSSLAVTADEENDGFLTALEIFRMKIPADLVVMSACETAKGKVYEAEGIVGLTRAFMYAGAPRVIASLWKVDDDATQALMIKFYELWNPKEGTGLGVAEALQRAQAFVRGHEKWEHPYYWAAWVLWGLPH